MLSTTTFVEFELPLLTRYSFIKFQNFRRLVFQRKFLKAISVEEDRTPFLNGFYLAKCFGSVRSDEFSYVIISNFLHFGDLETTTELLTMSI